MSRHDSISVSLPPSELRHFVEELTPEAGPSFAGEIIAQVARLEPQHAEFGRSLLLAATAAPDRGTRSQVLTFVALRHLLAEDSLRSANGTSRNMVLQHLLEQTLATPGAARIRSLLAIFDTMRSGLTWGSLETLATELNHHGVATSDFDVLRRRRTRCVRESVEPSLDWKHRELEAWGVDGPALADLLAAATAPDELASWIDGTEHTGFLRAPSIALSFGRIMLRAQRAHPTELEAFRDKFRADLARRVADGAELVPDVQTTEDAWAIRSTEPLPGARVLYDLLAAHATSRDREMIHRWRMGVCQVVVVPPPVLQHVAGVWGKARAPAALFLGSRASGSDRILITEVRRREPPTPREQDERFAELLDRCRAVVHEWEHWVQQRGDLDDRQGSGMRFANMSFEERTRSEVLAQLTELDWTYWHADARPVELAARMGDSPVARMRTHVERVYGLPACASGASTSKPAPLPRFRLEKSADGVVWVQVGSFVELAEAETARARLQIPGADGVDARIRCRDPVALVELAEHFAADTAHYDHAAKLFREASGAPEAARRAYRGLARLAEVANDLDTAQRALSDALRAPGTPEDDVSDALALARLFARSGQVDPATGQDDEVSQAACCIHVLRIREVPEARERLDAILRRRPLPGDLKVPPLPAPEAQAIEGTLPSRAGDDDLAKIRARPWVVRFSAEGKVTPRCGDRYATRDEAERVVQEAHAAYTYADTIGEMHHRAWIERARAMAIGDDPTMLALVARFLEAGGFHVTTAEHGVGGWSKAGTETSPHVIVVDEGMAGFDEVMARLASDSTLRDVPVVVATTGGAPARAPEHVRLTKPFGASDLDSAVTIALGGAASPPGRESTKPAASLGPAGTRVVRPRPETNPYLPKGGRCVLVVGGEGVGRRFDLEGCFTIGHGSDRDLMLADDTVSRRHGEIVTQSAVTTYRDTSTNGSLVSGEFVRGREVPLRSGDSIQIAGTVLRYLRGEDLDQLVDAELARVSTERREVRRTLRRALPSDVDAVLGTATSNQVGGVHERTMTVLFSDLRGFTSMSERVAPMELAALLREYFQETTEVIVGLEGQVDKFLGDGIMAYWGNPRPGRPDDHEHAAHACLAALMMRDLVAQARPRWRARFGVDVYARIGVHTGPMLIGDFGPTARMNYTVIGDSVNLASRLEGANKVYNTEVIISEATRAATPDQFETRELDRVVVKGRAEPVTIFELVARRGELSEAQRAAHEAFDDALRLYREGDRAAARRGFLRVLQVMPEDGPAQEYFQRCLAGTGGSGPHPV
ncbi:MAG: FHA domain-containing protein [Deltaproteobacteria bacterium]|nr:FHA domain-containing protein [Kofleriaceae bacterium]